MSSAGIMSFTKNMAMITNIISQGNSRHDNAMVDSNILNIFRAADKAQGDDTYMKKTLVALWQGINTVTMEGDNYNSTKIEGVHFGKWTAKSNPVSGSPWRFESKLGYILSSSRNDWTYCIPKGWSTKMYGNFGSSGSGTKEVGNRSLQYTIWYLWGAWFDEVLEQIATAMMTSTQPL
jgi:hypothetical protein